MYVTVKERKIAEARRRTAAAAEIIDELSRYARGHGGRYLLYGSTARGEMRADSDIDLLLDFPPDGEAEAWRFAEEVCARFAVEADIKPFAWCDAGFATKVLSTARVLA